MWTDAALWRAGLAWEHEFDGKADAHDQGAALKTWAMGGNSALLEAAVSCEPASLKGWTFEAGVNGRMGDYEGVAGRITGRYAF